MQILDTLQQRFIRAMEFLFVGGFGLLIVIIMPLVGWSFFDCTGGGIYRFENDVCIASHLQQYMVLVALALYGAIAAWFVALVCVCVAAVLFIVSNIIGLFFKILGKK